MNKYILKDMQLRLQEYEFEIHDFAGTASASAHSQTRGNHLINIDTIIETTVAEISNTTYKH